MITFQEHTGFIRVEEYGFAEWLAQVEQVIKQGYEFDFVNNENYPVGYGSMYTAVLVPVTAKTEVLVGKKEITEVTTDVAPSDTVDTPSETTVDEVTPVHQTKRKNARN